MKRLFVRAKIHRATVTDANLEYMGSISICPQLMEQAGIAPFEFVHVNNVRNGVHWETYAVVGAKGEITLNGPPAHHFQRNDKVIIFALAELEPEEVATFMHTTVIVDLINRPVKRVMHNLYTVAHEHGLQVSTHVVDLEPEKKYGIEIGV